MTAKEYLRQVRTARDAKNRLLNEALTLREQATRITTSMSATGGRGGDGRKLENAAVKLADLSREFEEQAAAYAEIEREVMATVNRLDEPYATILYLRYFEGRKWEEIAVQMSYSWQWTHKLHKAALKKIEAIVSDY